MAKLEIYPGFPSSILEAFKVYVAQMEPNGRLCVLVFDEMSLKCALHYNVERDNGEGLEDFGLTSGRTEEPAKSCYSVHGTRFAVKVETTFRLFS